MIPDCTLRLYKDKDHLGALFDKRTPSEILEFAASVAADPPYVGLISDDHRNARPSRSRLDRVTENDASAPKRCDGRLKSQPIGAVLSASFDH